MSANRLLYWARLSLKPPVTLRCGLLLFGAVFALNSAVHSYLIVSMARQDGVSLDVGFYYMANVMGRLMGTVLSGLLACLTASTIFLLLTLALSAGLRRDNSC